MTRKKSLTQMTKAELMDTIKQLRVDITERDEKINELEHGLIQSSVLHYDSDDASLISVLMKRIQELEGRNSSQ